MNIDVNFGVPATVNVMLYTTDVGCWCRWEQFCYLLMCCELSGGVSKYTKCWTHQPKKLTKSGVSRKRETSSLDRSGYSCVRNALLEMVNGAFKL
jgi:hypothetical protein